MEVEFAMLADAAEVVNGKLYVLGGAWNTLHCVSFPHRADLHLAVSILVDPDETGQRHPINVAMTNADGSALANAIDGNFQVGAAKAQGPLRTLFAFKVAVEVKEPGRCSITVTAGEAQRATFFDAVFTGKRIELHGKG